MTDLLEAASLAVAGVAVLAALLTLLTTGSLRSALPVALDFFTAAGLLRLSAEQNWRAIAGAAGIIVIRHLLSWAFARQRGLLPPGGLREQRRRWLPVAWARPSTATRRD